MNLSVKVSGLSHASKSQQFATCGEATHLWTRGRRQTEKMQPCNQSIDLAIVPLTSSVEGKIVVSDLDSQKSSPFKYRQYLQSLFDHWLNLSVPTRTFQWGVDSVHHVKFSPVEVHLLGAAASDRSIILYDTREVLFRLHTFFLQGYFSKLCGNIQLALFLETILAN